MVSNNRKIIAFTCFVVGIKSKDSDCPLSRYEAEQQEQYDDRLFHLVNLSEYELQPLFPQYSLVQQANSGLEYLQEESP